MDLPALSQHLSAKYGKKAGPEQWWPKYYRRSDPPELERAN